MDLIKKTKASIYKLKYADKSKSRLFVVLSFIVVFGLFVGLSYSEFIATDEMNAINIKIADLNFTLSNDNTRGSSSINVGANETKIINFTLTSQNNIQAKYALNYESSSNDIKVYYSNNAQNNMSGIIGTSGASIHFRVVIVNSSKKDETVSFSLTSGYVNQEDLKSNITEGYYEEALVKRTILLDENFENAIEAVSNPSIDSDYLYFDTICSEEANITWNINKNDVDIETESPSIACDVYFKKASKQDIELVYNVIDNQKFNVISEGTIDYNKYTYISSHCNNEAIIEFDNTTHEVTISDITSKTLCVVDLIEN